MPTPSEIAKSLTPVAETCILDPSELCGGIITDMLLRVGLVERDKVRDGIYHLTPIGLAVRAVLEQKKGSAT